VKKVSKPLPTNPTKVNKFFKPLPNPIKSSTETRGLELVQRLNKLPSHEAESILNQLEALIDEKSTKPRQYAGRRISPVIMAEQIKQEVIVKVDPDDFE